MKKHFWVWVCAIFSYIFTFGAPILASYFYFATSYNVNVGGSFFYFIVTIVFALLYKKMLKAVKKQKIGIPNAIFKFILTLVGLVVLFFVVEYIGHNFSKLIYVISAAIIGRVVGTVLEIVAIKVDRDYLEEIGVM
jgi:ABC-type antimicrobial peptide transport system permease subunit